MKESLQNMLWIMIRLQIRHARLKKFQVILKDNYNDLIENILENIDEGSFIEKGNNGYGNLFEQIIELKGANNRTANVLTAWIEEKKEKD